MVRLLFNKQSLGYVHLKTVYYYGKFSSITHLIICKSPVFMCCLFYVKFKTYFSKKIEGNALDKSWRIIGCRKYKMFCATKKLK